MRKLGIISLLALAALTASCKPSSFSNVDAYPEIVPDYVGVTMPESMAEPSFRMADGSMSKVRTERKGDTLWVSVSAWQKGAPQGIRYKSFPIALSNDPIDPYIVYRLIEPGYESWHDMGIYQRELSSYKESAIVTNAINERGCINCHTFPSGDPQRMIFHARGKGGGTVFVNSNPSGKDEVHILNLASAGPQMQGTYTAWNPDGRHIAFSSNSTSQTFYTSAHQPIEVFDTVSDMIIMDLETEEISIVAKTEDTLETFPTWSSDGRTLYFCSAEDPGSLPDKRAQLRYRLMSIDFDGTRFIGEPKIVLDIDSISVSFPRVKGDKLMFTASAFGTFPIWHDEADLWMTDLNSGEIKALDELNSDQAESYHSWSSNGKWVVFSSRRGDGRYTRLFISHLGADGRFSKPFQLPQKDADFDQLRLKSYNIPEFVTGKVPCRQDEIEKLFR